MNLPVIKLLFFGAVAVAGYRNKIQKLRRNWLVETRAKVRGKNHLI